MKVTAKFNVKTTLVTGKVFSNPEIVVEGLEGESIQEIETQLYDGTVEAYQGLSGYMFFAPRDGQAPFAFNTAHIAMVELENLVIEEEVTVNKPIQEEFGFVHS